MCLNSKNNSYVMAAIIYIFLIQGVPSIVNSIYWFNGSVHYTFAFFLTLLTFSATIRYLHSNSKKYFILSCLLAFLAAGGNVVTSFLNVLLLFTLVIFYIKRDKKILIPFVVSTIFFAINVFSPGTLYRGTLLSNSGFIETIITTAVWSRSIICDYVDFRFILFMIIAIAYGNIIKDQIKIKLINPIFIIIITYALFCSTLAVPCYSLGWFGPDRVTNVQWMAFCLLCAFVVVYSEVWFYQKGYIVINSKNSFIGVFAIIICFLGINISLGNNFNLIITELKNGTAQQYASDYDERLEIMESSNEDIIYVHSLADSTVLNFDDIKENANDWHNEAWQAYYGKMLIVEDDE